MGLEEIEDPSRTLLVMPLAFHSCKLYCPNHSLVLRYFIFPFPNQSVRSLGQEPWIFLFYNH